jgi:hypothetical protein
MARTAVRTLNELAGLIGAVVLIAGCGAPISAPVLRSPALFLFTAPAYDSPRCEDARRLDAQAATWWLPASCFKAVDAR